MPKTILNYFQPIDGFNALVDTELARARNGHQDQQSLHESYAILLEEVDELWTQVKRKERDRDPVNIREEFVQIAAMARRAAEDLGYVRQIDPNQGTVTVGSGMTDADRTRMLDDLMVRLRTEATHRPLDNGSVTL